MTRKTENPAQRAVFLSECQSRRMERLKTPFQTMARFAEVYAESGRNIPDLIGVFAFSIGLGMPADVPFTACSL